MPINVFSYNFKRKHKRNKYDNRKTSIRFVELGDINNISGISLDSKIKGSNRKAAKLDDGSRLVWDIDDNNFRVFNEKTIIKEKGIELMSEEDFKDKFKEPPKKK